MENENPVADNEPVIDTQNFTKKDGKTDSKMEMNAITEVFNYEAVPGKQEISSSVHANINLFVDAIGDQRGERFDFVYFNKGADRGTAPEFSEDAIKQFMTSRIMVINHSSNYSQLAVNAVEKLAFEYGIQHDFKPLCCSIQSHQVTHISRLIRNVSEDKIFDSAEEQMFIVFEQRSEDSVAAFIADITERGGGADVVSENLKINKLRFIYVCQNDRLFETHPLGQTHFGLYLIDPYIAAFFEIKKDAAAAMKLYTVAMDTIRKGGWLSDLTTESQKIEHLAGLIQLDILESEAANHLKGIDQIKESKDAEQLLADPLKNIVLFSQIFFEGISLSEYDELVRHLLSSISSELSTGGKNDAISGLLWDWSSNGDTILSECGIYLDNSSDKKVSSYRFLMEIREKIIRELLKNKFRMALARRHESIGERLVENPLAFSGTFIDAWFRLFFETATLDPYRYLLRFGLRLAALITEEDDTSYDSDEKKRLLIMLINLVGTWESHERLNLVIVRFYEEMKKTGERRTLLGTILAFHCSPERPQMLKRLKIHLESISKDEILFNLDVINSISLNYLEDIPSLLGTIMEWNEAETGNPLRSASHVRCAYLLLFYRQWPFQCKKGDSSYRILKQLVTTEQGLEILAAFIFGNGITEAFKLLHIDKYRQKYDTEPILKRTMVSHLHLMQALVLIQWYYLFNLIRADTPNAEWEVQQVFTICTREIVKTTDVGSLKSAIGRAATLLNYEIEEKIEEPEKKNIVQLLKRKRDGARELLKLI